MISSETIIVNSKFSNVFILCYYDGVKEEVSLDRKTIYLWYDYLEDASGEQWLEIVLNKKQIFVDYLSNRIGIRELIDNAMIFVCNRLYEKYSEIKRIKKVGDSDGIDLPENEFLGYDFFSKVVKRTTYNESSIKILEKSIKQILEEPINNFSQLIESDMKILKEIEGNVVQDEYFYPVAA